MPRAADLLMQHPRTRPTTIPANPQPSQTTHSVGHAFAKLAGIGTGLSRLRGLLATGRRGGVLCASSVPPGVAPHPRPGRLAARTATARVIRRRGNELHRYLLADLTAFAIVFLV